MAIATYSPATAYSSVPNIGHPGSSAKRTADALDADTEIETRTGLTVSGVAITAAR